MFYNLLFFPLSCTTVFSGNVAVFVIRRYVGVCLPDKTVSQLLSFCCVTKRAPAIFCATTEQLQSTVKFLDFQKVAEKKVIYPGFISR